MIHRCLVHITLSICHFQRGGGKKYNISATVINKGKPPAPSAFLSDAARCLSDSSKSPGLKKKKEKKSKEGKREISSEMGWEEQQHKNLESTGCLI